MPGTTPPDPWKLTKVLIAQFDAIDWALWQGQITLPDKERAAHEACREDIERWRAQIEANEL